MKKGLIIGVALITSATVSAMQKEALAYLYDRGLRNFYLDIQQYNKKFEVKDLPGGGFLLKGKEMPTGWPYWNYVGGCPITQKTIDEASSFFKDDNCHGLPYCLFVDEHDKQGKKLLDANNGYKFLKTFSEIIVPVQNVWVTRHQEDLKKIIGEEVRVEPVENDTDLVHWVRLMAEIPDFNIKPEEELLPIYQSFYKLVKKPGLLMSVRGKDKDNKTVTGSISSHLIDDICSLYSLSTGKKLYKNATQKLVVEAIAQAQEINKNAYAVYVGTQEDFKCIFEPLGFKEQRKVHVYAKKY